MPSGFVIDPPSLQTRLFQVNYIDLERRGTSRTRVASGQVGQSSNAQTPGGGGAASPRTRVPQGLSEPPGSVFAMNGNKDAEHVKEITGTSISTRSSSDFWPELEESLQALVGKDGGRAVVINAESGIVAVRATPRELRDVEQFLRKIQKIATQQVMIEAKIVEVQLSSAFQAGINWAAIATKGNQTYSAFQTGPQQGFPAPGLGTNNLQLLNQPSTPVTVGPAPIPSPARSPTRWAAPLRSRSIPRTSAPTSRRSPRRARPPCCRARGYPRSTIRRPSSRPATTSTSSPA